MAIASSGSRLRDPDFPRVVRDSLGSKADRRNAGLSIESIMIDLVSIGLSC